MRQLANSVLGLLQVASLGAQEHPTEHPTNITTKTAAIDKHILAAAIQSFITEDAALKGGAFLVIDDKNGHVLRLTLDKVHRDRLSKVGNDTYFACADFTTPKGKTYDLDIFMKGIDPSDLSVVEIAVHKEGGKARYTWAEKKGTWVKVSK